MVRKTGSKAIITLLLLALLGCRDRGAIHESHRPPKTCSSRDGLIPYHVILYGDEPPGLMTALQLQNDIKNRLGIEQPRILVLAEAADATELGGTISRSWLAYLDRNQIPPDLQNVLNPFSPSSDLYREFLDLHHVKQVAINPKQSGSRFADALLNRGIMVQYGKRLQHVEVVQGSICSVYLDDSTAYSADFFIDSSIGAVLAKRSGVKFRSGLGDSDELSSKSLSLGWIFAVDGLTQKSLRDLEAKLTRRLLDKNDDEALQWTEAWKRQNTHFQPLELALLDEKRRPKLAFSSTQDSIDQRSHALAISFHGDQHVPQSYTKGSLLDLANIAVIDDRLYFNSLLFSNNKWRNEALLSNDKKPTKEMFGIAKKIKSFFLKYGAAKVEFASELYVRNSDQIAHPLQTLDLGKMMSGGVPTKNALGTFTYKVDTRGSFRGWSFPQSPTFNFGYRHTLPHEISNLAVLGPTSGWGGIGVGVGRIIELNVSVGEGLAAAISLALSRQVPISSISETEVAWLNANPTLPYGRPTGASWGYLARNRFSYQLVSLLGPFLGRALWNEIRKQ